MIYRIVVHDEGIKDIRIAIQKLAKRYKNYTNKDPNKAKLEIIFKRGPITMANGEWSKMPIDNLTMDPNKVIGYFERKNLNWGILGYGSTKGGLKELMKYAKTKLNPKQLLGEGQDLKMKISSSNLFKRGDKVIGKLVIIVPDKSLGGKDIHSSILEKNGYLGINSWKKKALEKLGSGELDHRLKELLNNKVNLSEELSEYSEESKQEANPEQSEDLKTQEIMEDVKQALEKLKYRNSEIQSVMSKLDFSKGEGEAVKQALKLLVKKK